MSKYISKYFTQDEMQCSCEACGHSCPIDSIFLKNLDKLREESGGPLYVDSGFRCNSYNEKIGGVKSSWHTKGRASDIVPKTISLEDLKILADKYFEEVIPYKEKGFLHVGNPYEL
jgi:uncharacterized protein YcbK (DUF882 family)